jgi:bifunctional non-homologous end joining protein LigD
VPSQRSRASARPAEAEPEGPLGRYRAKRDFARTPEPPGAAAGALGRRFVVQKHAARRLHYDLRLELDGVYKSWAITRGPSLDPKAKRLAVHVEDHPLDYGTFEGTIPKGEYGGGTVMVWDQGEWAAQGDPAEAYREGRLKFALAGRKLRGAWMLVRMPDRGERQEPWLLIKEQDAFAVRGDRPLPDDDASVRSGRTMAQIAAGAAPPEARANLPAFVRPQLATAASEPPAGPGWLFEVKHDGYRCQLRLEGGRCTVRTRGAHDWTARFGGIAAAAEALPATTAVIDAEAVVLDERGVSSFALLRRTLEEGGDGVVCYAFDLLFLDAEDLRELPLVERKRRLEALLGEPGVLRYSEHVGGRGKELLQHACRLGAEGLIAKRGDQPYRSGRGTSWLKVKCEAARTELVIGGYTPARGRQGGLGALLVGTPHCGGLLYAGKVGTGWDSAAESRILAALGPLRRADMPFKGAVPPAVRRGARWVEPRLVAEVRFQEWTPDGMLRHARWLGMGEGGQTGSGASRTAPGGKAPRPSFGKLRLSHPERVVLADPPTTKADVWAYYTAVAGHLLPGVAGRPLSVIRCPSGAEGGCFFQRHLMPGMPKVVRPVRAVDGEEAYFAVDDLEGVLALVQFGAIELHPWGSRADRPDRPDRLVFDLDPAEGLSRERVTAAALELRERLRAVGLESFARTTGGKGLHVVVPIERRHGWAAAKRFTAGMARAMAADSPGRFTAKLAKAARTGRTFVDYLRNEHGATAVASYSLRARPGASVATPVSWDEVTGSLDPSALTLATVAARLETRADPWAGMSEVRQRLPAKA